MSYYPPDGEVLYGWQSFGRSFTWIGAAASGVAAFTFCVRAGILPVRLTAADALFASFLFWAGSALSALMLVCGFSSLMLSRRERGGVEVTPFGVRRIFSPSGKEEFFPREQISGMYARPEGGLALFDSTCARQMIVPRSIEGYRDCVAELKALGIPVVVPPGLRIGKPYRPQTRGQRIRSFLQTFIGLFAGSIAFQHYNHPSGRHFFAALIAAGLAALVVYVAFRKRSANRFELLFDSVILLLVLALIYLRW